MPLITQREAAGLLSDAKNYPRLAYRRVKPEEVRQALITEDLLEPNELVLVRDLPRLADRIEQHRQARGLFDPSSSGFIAPDYKPGDHRPPMHPIQPRIKRGIERARREYRSPLLDPPDPSGS